jgi:ornithine carbamoyltransferase
MKQRYGRWEGLTITYVGDGNNILHSLMLMAPKLGIKVNYCCPTGYGPKEAVVLRAKELVQGKGGVQSFSSPQEAVKSSHAVYTDVWTSMGFESQDSERHNAFEGFQVNEELMSLAADGACFLHCMPMVRGEEVSDTLPDSDCSVVFAQAENRLHVQKALIVAMMV